MNKYDMLLIVLTLCLAFLLIGSALGIQAVAKAVSNGSWVCSGSDKLFSCGAKK